MELYLNDVYPYAQQISNYIEREIFQQKLKTGQKLFSITNLANELNVSKHTIQLAYKILRSKGLIVKKGNEFFVTEDNCCIITKMKEETDLQIFINVNIKMYIFDHLRMYIFAILPLDRYIFLSDKIFL